LLPTDNPLSIGMVGMLGASRAGNFAIQNADLVLCVGCRLSVDTTAYEFDKFARDAKIIVVDIDENEHLKGTVKIDRFIYADAKSFLSAMNTRHPTAQYSDWCGKCFHWKQIFPVRVGEQSEGERLNEYHFVERLSLAITGKATIISDTGTALFTVTPAVRIRDGIRSITSGAQAEMGYSLPASIGAAFATGETVVAINGDGSVMMNLQELQTLVFHNLNVKLCIFNNNGYSCIRYAQDNAFRGREIGCDPSTGISFPDFENIAGAFGIKYVKIDASGDAEQKIQDMLALDGPVVCEVMCMTNQPFLNVQTAMNSKRRIVTRPLEDQAPFLDRELFESEMVIQPLD
jgi:acetolactate synthase-1/2/3 large subunit